MQFEFLIFLFYYLIGTFAVLLCREEEEFWSQEQKNINCSEHFPSIYLSVGAEVFLFMLKNSF